MLNLKPSFMSSDPEAPIPLEFVEDDFTEEEHRKLDKFFPAKLTPANFESLAPFYLSGMLMQLGPRGDTTITAEDCLSLVQEHPALRKLLLDGSYKLLRRWSKDSSSSTPITS